MAITLRLNFDDAWAARLAPVIENLVASERNHPTLIALIDGLDGIDSIDDLTLKQKARLWITFNLMLNVEGFEAPPASRAAGAAVIADIRSSFPLEVGDA